MGIDTMDCRFRSFNSLLGSLLLLILTGERERDFKYKTIDTELTERMNTDQTRDKDGDLIIER